MKTLIIMIFCTIAACNRRTDQQEIEQTIRKFLSSAENNDFSTYQYLVKDIPNQRTLEMQKADFDQIHTYVSQYYKHNTSSIKYFISGYPDNVDRSIMVTIPIYDGQGKIDSSNALKRFAIKLGFGPKNYISYKRLSHVFIESDYDATYNEYLMNHGLVPDPNKKFIDSLGKY